LGSSPERGSSKYSAQGGEQAGGLAAEFQLHAADSLFNDPRECATPAGMDGGDGAFFRIDQ